MVNKFGKIDPQGLSRPALTGLPTIEPGSHQERVYNEMFKAIELLGRRLEKSEDERDRLARRLSLIESATAVDEKTGRLYLPALVDRQQGAAPVSAAVPRWAIATSGISLCVAFVALFMAFSQSAPTLTKEQLAVLDSIAGNKIASLDSLRWKPVPDAGDAETKTPETVAVADAADHADDVLAATAPSDDDLPQPTLMADNAAMANGAPNDAAGAGLTDQSDIAAIEPALGDAAASLQAEDSDDATARLARAVEAEERAAQAPAVKEEIKEEITAAPKPQKPKVVVQKPAQPLNDVSESAVKPAEAPRPATKKSEPGKSEPASGNAAVYSRIPADTNLPPDLAQLEKRAAEDVPEAQHDLATLYAAGRSVPQDYKRAVYWFSRAADGGIANAHYNLGVMFQQGLGVRKDVKKAVRWYKSASELGHPEAMYNLGISYIEGIGIARDIPKGATYFRRAADAGVAQAAYNLGVLYESNFLGAADAGAAMEWYKKAADRGHGEARDAISRLQQARAQSLANQEPAAGE